jgi:uncharacterized protein YgbK (DUF1537 family)
MEADTLRVVADDLTGACDIAAALLPWEGGVLVEAYDTPAEPLLTGLRVCNTQSRVLEADAARAAVRRALPRRSADRASVVLKKIDTALRGHLGAELEAAMHAVGAAEGFVLAAIPAVGRTTIGGLQLIDGIPVHRTAFAEDPLHPVRDAAVAAHVERDSSQRCMTLGLEEIRSPRRLADAIERGREQGATAFVCDAESDDDLDRALEVLLARPRPVVLAGSLGLGAALRRRLRPGGNTRAPRPARRERAGGTLVVVGSAHPMARRQSDAFGAEAIHELALREDPERTGRRAAAVLQHGATAVLRMPAEIDPGAAAPWLERMARAVVSCAAVGRPGAVALVGGETAYAVLRALAQPCIRVVHTLGPLVVGGELVSGALVGTPVVTKGGSAGDARSLVRAVEWLAGAGR